MAAQLHNMLQYAQPAGRGIAGKLAVGFAVATVPLAAGVVWADYDRKALIFLAAITCASMAFFSSMWSVSRISQGHHRFAGIVAAIALLELLSVLAVGAASDALVRPRVEDPRTWCASHMRQILLAILMYANEQPDGRFPPSLDILLTTEDIGAETFVCPSSNLTWAPGATAAQQSASMRADPAHYLSYSYFGRDLTNDPKTPPQAILFEPLSDHGDGANVGYSDGTVMWLNRKQAIAAIKAALTAAATRPATRPSVLASSTTRP